VRVDPALVRLVPWTEDDLALLVRLNTPEMTEHLGGPETDEQVLVRHERYVAAARSGIVRETDREYRAFIFKAVVEPEGADAGNVNFWDREWKGEQVYEMGWAVVPEFQGRGIASAMVAQAVELARATNRRPAVHAFPSVDNPPSNGVCRKAGFTLVGEGRFEYPKGHWMQCNDWRLELARYR
jgi:RimJ/RimL family protein N-acetyltransferase